MLGLFRHLLPGRKPKEEMPARVREQVEKLKDPDSGARLDAAVSLGMIGHVSAVPYLAKALHDKSINVRGSAAVALGEIGHVSAVPHLAKALQDSAEGVRVNVAWALGEIKHESAVPYLAKALRHPNSSVRFYAAKTLWGIGHECTIPHLAKALQDKDTNVRLLAANALVNIGRTVRGNKVESNAAKALQLVWPLFRENEEPFVIHKAYQAALKGKVTKENARLYVKQLRALTGKVK